MTTTWYRVQDATRDVTDLLDPELQVSHSWLPGGAEDDAETNRRGVSVCDSIENLILYLAGPGEGIGYGDGWVIVELTGVLSEDEPLEPRRAPGPPRRHRVRPPDGRRDLRNDRRRLRRHARVRTQPWTIERCAASWAPPTTTQPPISGR